MSDDNMELPEGFDDPSYGGAGFENRSLKPDTTAVYRILPAMKSLRKRKDYAQFWYTHFYLGQDPKDPTKKKSHPILCIQEKDFRNGGIVVKKCPLCVKRAKYQDKVKAIEGAGKQRGKSRAEIAKAQQPANQWLKDHGCDGKWRMYAKDKQGTLCVLRITHTTMKDKLRPKVKKLLQDGYTPMGVKGLWWEFTRTGRGFDTNDEVEPVKEKVAGGGFDYATDVLSKDVAKAALDVLPDFDEEQERIRYSEEILQQLADCNDDPAEVNRILGINKPQEGPSDDLGDGEFPESTDEAGTVAANDVADDAFGEETTTAADEPAAEEDDEEAALARQMAVLKAKKAAAIAVAAATKVQPATKPLTKPAPTTKKPGKPEPTEFDPAAASDEEYDALWGNDK